MFGWPACPEGTVEPHWACVQGPWQLHLAQRVSGLDEGEKAGLHAAWCPFAAGTATHLA